MRAITTICLSALLILSGSASSLRAEQPTTEEGFQSLFNGRDLTGWRIERGDPALWTVEDGAIVGRSQDYRTRSFLLTEREYADFILRVEFNLDPGTGSAVALRALTDEEMPYQDGSRAYDHPMLKLIESPGREETGTTHWLWSRDLGGVYLKPDHTAQVKPAGSWNFLEIEVHGRTLRASVNGKPLTQNTSSEGARCPDGSLPGLNRVKGRIGLQKHTGTTRFRKLQVKELASTEEPTTPTPAVAPGDESGFQTLFNGRDLNGWTEDGINTNWRVENGEIVSVGTGYATANFLLTDKEYRNYSLRFDFKVGENANSGIALRALPGERTNGLPRNLEVQIHDDEGLAQGQGEPTGSLFWSNGGPMMRPTKQTPLKPRGEWNHMEVEARGRLIRAWVNGEFVLAANLQPFLVNPLVLPSVYRDQGRVGLQSHTGEIRFRNVRIKELTPDPLLVLDADGHTGSVRGAVFTQDSKQLITASHDKTIRIWDVESGKSLRVLRPPLGSGKIGEYFGVALAPDGKTLAAGGFYGRLFLIDVPSGRVLHFLVGHTDSVFGLDFSPDGRQLATAGADRSTRIWDVATGKVIRTLFGHTGFIRSVRFSPDGRKLATGAEDRTAQIFSADDGSLLRKVTLDASVQSVDWSRDGQVLVTGDSAGTGSNGSGNICLWNSDGTQIRRFEAPGGLTSLRATNDGAVLYTWSKYPHKGAVILDLESGQPRVKFDRSWNDLECSALSPDGRLAVTAGFDAADLRVWRTADAQEVHQLRARGSVKWSAGWGPDGTTIAWGNDPYRDRPMHFYDMGPRTHSFDLKTLQVGEPSGDYQTGSATVDDLHIEHASSTELRIKRSGEVVSTIDTKPLGGYWRSAAWVNSDHLMIGSNFGDLSLVDKTGKVIRRYIGHVGTIWGIAPSPDRRYLLTASQDSTLRIWSIDQSSPILTLYFANDGEWIAGAEKGYYAASPGGERLMGWQVSNGLNTMASFYPASQFRKTLYRPDVIKRLIESGNLKKALALVDASSGRSSTARDVAQILPPTVAITSPTRNGNLVVDRTIDVAAVARSVGTNPVNELRVQIDGRPLPDAFKTFNPPVLGEAHARWTIEVPPGSHHITVQASSAVSKGLSEPLDVVRGSDDDNKASGKLYLLAIGINDYLYLGDRSKLDCAAPDARAIHQTFRDLSRSLFASVESRLLVDRQATRANILAALQWLKQNAKPGDKAVIFYAGHGDNQITGQFYIIPVDARTKDLRTTGISDEELKQTIGELPCTTVLMLDACYSGSFGTKQTKSGSLAKPSDALAGDMINDHGLATLCGAKANQEAIEEGGHGFFTLALTQGMAGQADNDKDGIVELYELLPFVCSRVRKLSAGDQVPTFGIPQSIDSFPMAKP